MNVGLAGAPTSKTGRGEELLLRRNVVQRDARSLKAFCLSAMNSYFAQLTKARRRGCFLDSRGF